MERAIKEARLLTQPGAIKQQIRRFFGRHSYKFTDDLVENFSEAVFDNKPLSEILQLFNLKERINKTQNLEEKK